MNFQINGTAFSKKTEDTTVSNNYMAGGEASAHVQAAGREDAILSQTDAFCKTEQNKTVWENEYMQKEEESRESTQKKEDFYQQLQDNLKRLQESVGTEDFSKLEELGLLPDEEEPSVVVSVYDRIQIELATYCEDYQVTGDISKDVIEKVASDAGMAQQIQIHLEQAGVPCTHERIEQVQQAWESLQHIEPLERESVAYMVSNHMEPTIENIYVSQHAVISGQTPQIQLTEEGWQELQPQVEQLLQKSGIEVSDDILTDARWMVEQGIALTTENLHLVQQIYQVDSNMDLDTFSKQLAQGMALGLPAMQVSLAPAAYDGKRVQDAMAVLEKAEESQIEQLVYENKEVNIANLSALQEQSMDNDEGAKQRDAKAVYEQTKSRRILEEIRLQMTAASGKMMLKAGISIELTPLEDMIDYLKKQEIHFSEILFSSIDYEADAQEKNLLIQTIRVMEYLKTSPAAVLGQLDAGNLPSLPQMQDIAKTYVSGAQSIRAEQAAKDYETMQTQVRTDLGDSIGRAFVNSTDSILEQLGLEKNEINRRAVRILGYNQMDIHAESIENVKQVDRQVQSLFHNLNPKTTAYLIANKINPLEENIQVLNEKLEQINEKFGTTREKYSTYLWELEKNHEITQEERDAYIGIYRLLRMIEKSDGAVLGAMIEQGSEFTMKNMLTTLRSKKASGMEVKVDENFGELVSNQSLPNQGEQSLQQTYYKQLSKEALDLLSGEKINQITGNEEAWENLKDMSLEQFVERMQQEVQESKKAEDSRLRQQMQEWQQVQHISEETVDYVLKNHQKPSVVNLLAASMMMKSKGGVFGALRENGLEEEYGKTLELEEHLDSKEEMQQAYEGLEKEISNRMIGRLEQGLTTDVSQATYRMLQQGLSFVRKSSDCNRYQLPIEIQGETACVRLTIRQDDDEKGKVSIQMGTRTTGEMYGEFSLYDRRCKGTILVQEESWKEYVEQHLQEFTSVLEQNDVDIAYMQVGGQEELGNHLWLSSDAQEDNGVDNRQLFDLAKQFIKTVKNWALDYGKDVR